MKQKHTFRERKARLSEIPDPAAAGFGIENTRQDARKGRFQPGPNEDTSGLRQPGVLKGKIEIPDDFDVEDTDIVAGFESRCE